MHDGVSAPRSPCLARGKHLARVGLAERLHHAQVRVGKRIGPGARASAMMLRARALGMPMRAICPGDRAAMRVAVGNSVVRDSKGVTIGSPNAAAKRPARVRAAATATCWPRIARTAI